MEALDTLQVPFSANARFCVISGLFVFVKINNPRDFAGNFAEKMQAYKI